MHAQVAVIATRDPRMPLVTSSSQIIEWLCTPMSKAYMQKCEELTIYLQLQPVSDIFIDFMTSLASPLLLSHFSISSYLTCGPRLLREDLSLGCDLCVKKGSHTTPSGCTDGGHATPSSYKPFPIPGVNQKQQRRTTTSGKQLIQNSELQKTSINIMMLRYVKLIWLLSAE